MRASKYTLPPDRLFGRWSVGLNHAIGKITGYEGDRYVGHRLDGSPWWTRVPTVLDDSDNAQLEELYEQIHRGSGS